MVSELSRTNAERLSTESAHMKAIRPATSVFGIMHFSPDSDISTESSYPLSHSPSFLGRPISHSFSFSVGAYSNNRIELVMVIKK
mmetsp:Transcript_10001/g.21392  ORF Transcript_10001/g.21392 Transcript_10001/m.21392 type:complete len:85 (-) Transcript_10001:72-326(-)